MLRLILYTVAAFGIARDTFSICEKGRCEEEEEEEEEVNVEFLQQEVIVSNTRGDQTFVTPAHAHAPAHSHAHAPAYAEAHSRPSVATTTSTPDPTGVTLNAVGDLKAFVAALIANSILIIVFVIAFSVLRLSYPMIYSNNVMIKVGPRLDGKYPPDTLFGWMRFAMFTRVDEIAKSIGLDNALMLEFSQLCMKIMAIIGIPMIAVVGVLNWNLGGNAKCSKELGGCDNLSSFSFGNVLTNEQAVERGVPTPWLYWLHAFVVWGVVLTVQVNVYAAQGKFLQLRYAWLQKLPKKRANTIMVEGITDHWRSDERLAEFFTLNIKDSTVKNAYVIRNTTNLLPLVNARDSAEAGLKKAEAELKKTHEAEAAAQRTLEEANASNDAEAVKAAKEAVNAVRAKAERPSVSPSFCAEKVDAIGYYTKEIENLTPQIEAERKKIEMGAQDPTSGFPLHIGFVQFEERYHAELALSLNYTQDNEEFVVANPPVASDILWADLTQDPSAHTWRTVIGYLLVAGLYFAYLPMVIGVTNIANLIDMGPLQPVWQGLAPAMGLQIMVAMLPTFLMLIFHAFFTLKAQTFAQLRLQNWYYVFQVFFVILATSVGQIGVPFLNTLVTDPFATFGILADTMPYATHFYMNYLMLQWASHFLDILRYRQLGKYKGFLKIFEEEVARGMAEPEDQDYYGIGSRSARWVINMNVGIVFGTLSPPICFLTFMNFLVCRFVYGYLIPFAETKKADLGGPFWVTKMKHMFFGNIIYCILMTGVFVRRADSWGPPAIAAPSIFYVFWSMKRFESMFAWEKLPNIKVVNIDEDTGENRNPDDSIDKKVPNGQSKLDDSAWDYKQPELSDETQQLVS